MLKPKRKTKGNFQTIPTEVRLKTPNQAMNLVRKMVKHDDQPFSVIAYRAGICTQTLMNIINRETISPHYRTISSILSSNYGIKITGGYDA